MRSLYWISIRPGAKEFLSPGRRIASQWIYTSPNRSAQRGLADSCSGFSFLTAPWLRHLGFPSSGRLPLARAHTLRWIRSCGQTVSGRRCGPGSQIGASARTIWTARWRKRRSITKRAQPPAKACGGASCCLIREAVREPLERDTLYGPVTHTEPAFAILV